jgi:hypothetical protein
MDEVTPSSEQLEPHEKRKYWEGHIHKWEQSGLSQAEYCRQNDLKNHRWWYWRKRISRPTDNDVAFVPLRFSTMSPKTIRVITPNGYRIELDPGFDFSKLRQLITSVRGL